MSELAWLDSKLMSYESAELDSMGWPDGAGIFETVKTVGGQPWALSRHMRRALNSARRNDLPFPNEELIRQAVAEVIASNPFAIGRLRIHFGDKGNLLLTHQEYLEIDKPARLGVFSRGQVDFGVVEKRYPYTENLQLLAQAQNAGFDDFLLINQQGKVSETAIANVIVQIQNEWVTPPLSAGVLPGVMRALFIEKAGVLVRQIDQVHVPLIQSGFVISSLKIAQPISHIDGKNLEISPESEQMRSLFAATALATSVG